MNNTTHTPEPWRLGRVTNAQGVSILSGQHPHYPGVQWIAQVHGTETQEANAYRIVQCVNACHGIQYPETEIPALKLMQQDYAELTARLIISEEKREKLFEVLLKVRASMQRLGIESSDAYIEICDALNACQNPKPCEKHCGENYCDENGCTSAKPSDFGGSTNKPKSITP
jgi:hypothetical protein